MNDRLTPPPDGTIERVPEPPIEDEPYQGDLCDRCSRSGVQIARTDFAGNTVCVDCDEEPTYDDEEERDP